MSNKENMINVELTEDQIWMLIGDTKKVLDLYPMGADHKDSRESAIETLKEAIEPKYSKGDKFTMKGERVVTLCTYGLTDLLLVDLQTFHVYGYAPSMPSDSYCIADLRKGFCIDDLVPVTKTKS